VSQVRFIKPQVLGLGNSGKTEKKKRESRVIPVRVDGNKLIVYVLTFFLVLPMDVNKCQKRFLKD
jgi:hypothetical protein